MSVQSEISRLEGAKADLKTAIESKGVSVPETAALDAYGALVEQIDYLAPVTANRALVSNSSGKVAASAVTATELGYLDGVTSGIQSQLNGKAAASHSHSAGNITSGTLPVSRGGTGAASSSAARTALGAAEGYTKTASVSAPGWYRIATSGSWIVNNMGLFSVKGSVSKSDVSGRYTNAIFAAGITYGDNPVLQPLMVSSYAVAAIPKIRLVYSEAYADEYAYLEIYLDATASATIDISLVGGEGWTLADLGTAGTIPSGYVTKECVLANGGVGGYDASRALMTEKGGVITASAVTAAELGCLSGVTSSIQTQLDGKAATSHGTHVTYSTTPPKTAGTASAGSASTVARSDHVHPAQTTVSGNAGTATKLATARTIRTNLASTSTASFDGSANIVPGVTGTLPIANGGTGKTTAAAALYALVNGSAASITTDLSTDDFIPLADASAATGKKMTIATLKYFLGLGNGALKIETGSYTGTGTYGEENPNRLTFSFKPKLVVLVKDHDGADGGLVFIQGQSRYANWGSDSSTGSNYSGYITWSENAVSWWEFDKYDQFNAEYTYRYAAIG